MHYRCLDAWSSRFHFFPVMPWMKFWDGFCQVRSKAFSWKSEYRDPGILHNLQHAQGGSPVHAHQTSTSFSIFFSFFDNSTTFFMTRDKLKFGNKVCRCHAIYSDGRRRLRMQTTTSEHWSTASWASREAGIPVWWSTCFHRAPGDQRQWATTVGEHSLTHSGVAMALVSDTVLCPKTGDENASSDFWIM